MNDFEIQNRPHCGLCRLRPSRPAALDGLLRQIAPKAFGVVPGVAQNAAKRSGFFAAFCGIVRLFAGVWEKIFFYEDHGHKGLKGRKRQKSTGKDAVGGGLKWLLD